MNRRQKIIVSVTGIFLVLLILVGLTYAYFLTRIDGNDAEKSISVTTANLSLVYSDNSSELITSTTPIVPGEFEASKTFTVTNNGNTKVDSYAVILENFSVKYVNDIPNTEIKANMPTSLVHHEDMKMTITCTITSQDANRNGKSCNGVSNGILPTSNDILVMNAIEQGDTHNYTMSLEFIDNGNQSEDMNKIIEGRINIIDGNETVDLTGEVSATDVAYVEVSENTSATQTSDKTDGTVKYLDELESNTNLKSIAFETKRANVINKEYKIVGIPAGNYNIKMYNSSNTQVGSTQVIEIVKGTEASVSGNKITITNKSRTASVDITNSGLTIDKVEDIEENNIIKSGTLELAFANGNEVSLLTNKIVEDVDIKTQALSIPFSVKNAGDTHQNLTIKLTDIVMDSALKNIDFRWGLYNADTEVGLSFGIFKYTESEELIYRDTIIDAESDEKNYILRIWVHNNGTAQTELLNKSFKGNISVTGEAIEYTDESCFKVLDDGSLVAYREYYDSVTSEDVTIGNNCPSDVVIPKTVKGITVTKIDSKFDEEMGTAPFKSKNLTSIIIPDTVTYIGNDAFNDNDNLKHITLPESINEIVIAFSDNSDYAARVKSIFIPDSIEEMAGYNFGFAESIEEPIILSISTIGAEIFNNNLIKDIILMDGVTLIEVMAFAYNNLNTIEIPKSVNNIEEGAFQGNPNVKEIIVRKSEEETNFDENWNCVGDYDGDTCSQYADVIYRP